MTSTNNVHNKRRKLSEAQNHKCCYCGMVVYSEEEIQDHKNSTKKGHRIISTMDLNTFEHLVKKENDGKDHHHNLVIACHFCNSIRANRTPEEHFEWIQKNIEYIHFRKKWAFKKDCREYLKIIEEKYSHLRKETTYVNDDFYPSKVKKVIYIVKQNEINIRSFFINEIAIRFSKTIPESIIEELEVY